MKQLIVTFVILSSITALIGCKDSSDLRKQVPKTVSDVSEPVIVQPNDPPPPESPAIPSTDTVEITGTIVYKTLEGGFYAIEAEDGSKYDPMNLPESFKKDGMKIKINARLKPDVMGFHMYGSIIEVIDIVPR